MEGGNLLNHYQYINTFFMFLNNVCIFFEKTLFRGFLCCPQSNDLFLEIATSHSSS